MSDEEQNYGEIAEGTYCARAVRAEFGCSKVKMTPQIRIEWVILGGEYDGEHVSDFFALTERAMGRTLAVLRACGCTIPEGEDPKELLEFRGLGSEDSRITVGYETFNGIRRPRIKWVALDMEMDDSFYAQVRRALARSKGGKDGTGTPGTQGT